jgi:hypothetical protein
VRDITQGAHQRVGTPRQDHHRTQGFQMSNEKPAPKTTRRLTFVQFDRPVMMGGDVNAMEFWSAQKHGPESREPVDCEDHGNFILLYPCVKQDGKVERKGDRRRVPITNVTYLREEAV